MFCFTGKKAFGCDECDKTFPTRKQLKAHKLSHSGLMPYTCDYCKYKCKTRFHLLRHMRIHSGSRPYTCSYCQYSATTIGNLRTHVLKSGKHPGLAMYECTEVDCTFNTNTSNALSQHLAIEHGKHNSKLMTKSTENDWTEVDEGHSIIPLQH